MIENEMTVSVPLEVVKASEIEPKEIEWLWYPFIPYGKVTLLQGDPGDGKSIFMLTIAALAANEVRWLKRCKDETLRGTVKEVINQVSHSKRWKNTVPLLNENGQQVIGKYGRSAFQKSYSVLQDRLFEHMSSAGFTGFERGVLGSTAENLSSLDIRLKRIKSGFLKPGRRLLFYRAGPGVLALCAAGG